MTDYKAKSEKRANFLGCEEKLENARIARFIRRHGYASFNHRLSEKSVRPSRAAGKFTDPESHFPAGMKSVWPGDIIPPPPCRTRFYKTAEN